MTTKPEPNQSEIRYAIDYALRSEVITATVHDGCDGWEEVEVTHPDLEPFVMCLLRELKVIS